MKFPAIFRFSIFGLPVFSLAAFVLLAVLFISCPEIDLWASRLAADPETLFYLNHPLFVKIVYHSVEVLAAALSAGIIGLAVTTRIKKRAIFGFSSKTYLFLLLALMLGPGLVVNLISKNIWGRARPAHIEAFGGTSRFTPAFVFSDQCDTNCAFVSGHSALAFYLIAFAMPMKRQRKKTYALAITYGALVGACRMYQGGHFLSDVIFSFFFVYFPVRMLYHLMFERRE